MKAIAESERKVAGENASPYAIAQFLAIRDQFADKWQPQDPALNPR